MTNTNCFERYEKKYLLTESEYRRMRELLSEYFSEDRYGYSTVSSLYFDSDDFELIRRSIEKPIYKEKLRLRGYGKISRDSTLFLEIKKKYRGVVYKRRVEIDCGEAARWINSGETPLPHAAAPNWAQIMSEIDYMRSRNSLSPKILIAYDRIALVGREDTALRITFDGNIRCRTADLDLTHGSYGEPILPHGMRLMEIKVPGAFPLWLSEILDREKIYPTSFSKYGRAYEQLCLKRAVKVTA